MTSRALEHAGSRTFGGGQRLVASIRYHAPFLISLVLVIVIWEVVGRVAGLLILPPLSQITSEFWTFLMDGTFFDSLAASLVTYAIGMGISIVIGMAIGFLMARYRNVEYALDVYVNAAMSAPMIAFVPLFIILFGLGPGTRIVTVFVFAVFPILVNTFAGIRNVEPSLVEMGKSFGATERQLLWRIRVPNAFPLIGAGLHLGAARGVKGLINGEVLIAVVGLGSLVHQYGTAFSMDKLYAVIFFIVAIAFTMVKAVDLVSARMIRH